jgi:hypothetical protein
MRDTMSTSSSPAALAAPLTTEELAAKADEIARLVAVCERQRLELKVARDAALTAVERTFRADGMPFVTDEERAAYDAAEARLADIRAKLARIQSVHDEANAALQAIGRILADREAAERRAALDMYLDEAGQLYTERLRVINELEQALTAAGAAAARLIATDRALAHALVLGERAEYAKHLDRDRLGRAVRALTRAAASNLADLLGLENPEGRFLDLSPTGTFRRPFDVWSIAMGDAADDIADDAAGDREAA